MKPHFIPHCDSAGCCLGSFEYKCPNCGNIQEDYKIWWEESDIYKGHTVRHKCGDCNVELVTKLSKKGNIKVSTIS